MKTRKRGFLRTMVSALAIFMALTLAAPAALAKGYELDNFAGPDNLIYGGKFYREFSSLDEVFEAAKKLNGEVVAAAWLGFPVAYIFAMCCRATL